MATTTNVLQYLRPNGGWVITNNDFDTIVYDEGVEPITKKEHNEALKIVDKIKADKELANASAKSALLEKLGITAEEAKLLLS
jgi:hypothetical protein